MERRQVIAYQMDLFIEQNKNAVCPSDNCEDVNRAKAGQAGQLNKERQQGRALAEVRKVKVLTETATCESMRGGVRGRGSNPSPYSIYTEAKFCFK
jgi:hypothetical protein